MKITKYLVILGLGFGLTSGNMKALTEEEITAFKALLPLLKTSFKLSDDLAANLMLGLDLADFGVNFKTNVGTMKTSLAAAASEFKTGLPKLTDLRQKLGKDSTLTPEQKEALIPEVNELIIGMLSKFQEFMSSAGNLFIIPMMKVAEKIPSVGDKMKLSITPGKPELPFSTFTTITLGGFKDAMEIERNLVPKINDMIKAKAELSTAAAAAGVAPASSTNFDDI